MSHAETADGHHAEVVIVRHGHGDHEDGHHGGAWKIAFADFMTAMMCFFLVMWLINASNEQTRAAVASYFNPVKLIDRNASRKGLEDIGDGPESSGTAASEATNKPAGAATSGPSVGEGSIESTDLAKQSDAKLFADPYAVLAEIVADTGIQQNLSAEGAGGAQKSGPATGASGGEAYRDPFAPDFWSQEVAPPNDAEASIEFPKVDTIEGEPAVEPQQVIEGETMPEKPAQIFEKTGPGEQATELAGVPPKPETGQDGTKPGAGKEEATAPQAAEAAPPLPAEKPAPPEAAKPAEAVKEVEKKPEPTEQTIAAADQIRRELAAALLPEDRLKDGISVVATDKGVRISVTDQLDFGMFEIGSALPRRELILAMEKIARAVSQQKGTVTVSGHTDARPFRSNSYDNWRLSTARAHAAYYMLARAGLDEKRITEVSGYADRKLKNPADPFDATNRRIEILLEVPQ